MRTFKSFGKGAFYLLLPIIFLLIPTSWFESHPSLCLIRYIFGVKCPGCGMTRALSCAFHGNFKKALQYNRLVVIVFPLLCYVWLRGLLIEYQQYRLTPHSMMLDISGATKRRTRSPIQQSEGSP